MIEEKMIVSEYASRFNLSVQSVYQRIKRGTLKSVKENGVKYVILGEEGVESDLKPKVESDCKDLLKLVKFQSKEIKRLTKELSQTHLHSQATMKGYIDKLEAMQLLPSPTLPDEDIIEVETKKKKKKKKKKN